MLIPRQIFRITKTPWCALFRNLIRTADGVTIATRYGLASRIAIMVYNLRGLFRPQLDELPLSEQLVLYQQRDMTTSHLYRTGTLLFGSRGATIRRRTIDSSLYSSTDISPHARLFNRSLNGGLPDFLRGCKSAVYSHSYSDCSNGTTLPTLVRNEDRDVLASSDLYSKFDYLKWIIDRQTLRRSVEGPDALKHWLMWKDQTPVENYLLTNLHTRKVSDAMHNYLNKIKGVLTGLKYHNMLRP